MSVIRILIVEDDRDICELFDTALDPPYECLRAANGLEGFQMALDGEPDLIISDIMMPLMDGHEFIRRLRRESSLQTIPVIFLSALGSREKIREGYELGATLYLTKPIDPTRLKRNVDLFIKDHGVQARPKTKSAAEVRKGMALQSESEPFIPSDAPRDAEKVSTPPPPAADPEPEASAAAQKEKPKIVRADSGMETGLKSAPHRKARVRVLVVEDDADSSEMILMGLQDRFEAIPAQDGIEAIERAARYHPDVFIIDGMLPRMTGYQLVGMLKKNEIFHDSPIVFISGKASVRDKQYVQKLGVTTFIAKPFEIPQLLDTLDKIVAHPNFKIREDRISHQQVALETLRDFETRRAEPGRASSLARGVGGTRAPGAKPAPDTWRD